MKKWYTIGYLLCLSFVLASCYSFNHITLPEKTTDETTKQIVKEVVRPKNEAEKSIVLCPLYVMPAFSKTPELPFEEILQADKNNPKELDRIRQDHIDDLRQYIAKFKQDLRASHNEYLKDCYYRNGLKTPESTN